MKKFKSIICAVLLFPMILSMFLTASAAENGSKAGERSGIKVDRVTTNGVTHPKGYYVSDKKLEAIPMSYEAWVYIPSDVHATASGVILGTEWDAWNNPWEWGQQSNDTHFSFGIKAGGHPCLVYGKNGQKRIWEFAASQVIIPADKWTHITILHDTRSTHRFVWCIIDGDWAKHQKSGTDNFIELDSSALDNPVYLAGDGFRGNSNSLNGIILGDVAVYSDRRADGEFQRDYQSGPDLNDPELLMYYQISSANQGKDIKDKSGNGYHMNYYRTFLTEAEMNAIRAQDKYDYAYSIAFLPDFQYMTHRHTSKLNSIFKYIVDNKTAKNIQYVVGVGDMTDWDNDWEWAKIKEQYALLDKAGIPYTVVRGNHDGDGVKFNQTFGKGSEYYKHVEKNGGFYDKNSAANTYVLFEAGTTKYLILNLDWGITSTKVLEWADSIIAKYPEYRAMVVMHSWLNSDGTLLDNGDWGAPNGYNSASINPTQMWKNYFAKHPNIDMIVGGHMHSDNILVTPAKGTNGNTVQQLLINSQFSDLSADEGGFGGLGLVAIMYFTEDGSHAKVEYYSTVFKKYYYEKNAEISLDFGNAASGSVVLGGNVTLKDKDLKDGAFTLELYEANSSFATNGTPQTVTNKDGKFSFRLDYAKADAGKTYYYIVKEANSGKTANGITNSSAQYKITVKVKDDGTGGIKITATVDGGTSVKSLNFANTYKVDSNATVKTDIGGKVTLTGKTLKDRDVVLNLYKTDKNFTTSETPETVTNIGGKFSFTLNYTAADAGKTYYYVVKQANAGHTIDGTIYASTVYKITVKVTDDGKGSLKVTTTVNGGTSPNALDFVNSYKIAEDAIANTDIGGSVTLTGKDIADGAFTFELYESDESFSANGTPETITNVGGKFAFGLEYTAEDIGKTFYYVIKQANAGQIIDGVVYSSAVYKISVTVEDDGIGGIKATATEISGAELGKLDFANSDKGADEDITTPDVPGKDDNTSNTDDINNKDDENNTNDTNNKDNTDKEEKNNNNLWMWIVAGVVGICALIAGSLALLLKKKH